MKKLKRFLYVRCEVSKPNPMRASLFQTLYEGATGQPVADTCELDPSRLSFAHCFIEAKDEDEAYLFGGRKLNGFQPDGLFMNDYVVELNGAK